MGFWYILVNALYIVAGNYRYVSMNVTVKVVGGFSSRVIAKHCQVCLLCVIPT